MPGPFPGMDPYLESPMFWEDFHGAFIYAWREELLRCLPSGYDARVGLQVYLVEPPTIKLVKPDVGVTNGPRNGSSIARPAPAGAVTVEPVACLLEELMEVEVRHIEIVHEPDLSLVTVLEVLSPANKEQPGRGEYLDKRHRYRRQGVHLVELDLLRAGQRLPIRGDIPPGNYFAYVARAEEGPTVQVYPLSLRLPLPALPIPLRAPETDVWTDLQKVFTLAYERGGYSRRLPYDKPLAGPLSEEDRAWVQKWLEAHPSSGTGGR